MSCRWSEEIAQRFADGALDPETRAEFAAHLANCEVCQGRVAEAERIESLLRAGLTPVTAPVTLASRVMGSVTAERERRRPARLRLFGRWSVSPVLAGLALVLVLSLGSYAVAPEAVTALARRVLLFIPGLGTERVNEDTLVSTGPVSAQVGNATLTVEALLSDGEQTTIRYNVTGLPGGKSGWERHGQPRTPTLSDASGHEYEVYNYEVYNASSGVGGSPEENIVKGTMNFAPLPVSLRSVQLVVPVDYVVPPTALPGSDSQAWVVDIPMVPAQESALPAATPQSAEATVRGVTLRVAASTQEGERTVLLVEGEAEANARVLSLSKMGGNADEMASVTDGRGRTYSLIPQGSGASVVDDLLQQDLYFQPVPANVGQLTLCVPAVQVSEKAETDVTIPLAGHQLDETFSLDRTIDLGGHPVTLTSARLAYDASAQTNQDQPWLYVYVDLGPTTAGRTLSSFGVQRVGGSASMQGFGSRGGEQMSEFGVPVDLREGEVTIHMSGPIVSVEGPWEMTFSASGQ